MPELKTVLDIAAGEGIISAAQADKLVPYLQERGTWSSRVTQAGDGVVDTESPRFVRGFHDILITIGVIVALAGMWGIGSIFAVFAATIILAEILVRRQRLALPAVTLTVAFVTAIGVAVMLFLPDRFHDVNSTTGALLFTLPFPLLLAGFYWRYRVPLSLAGALASALAVCVVVILSLLSKVTGGPAVLTNHNQLPLLVILAAALALFAVAMRFDLKDPNRQSRDSDVAFWLHLGTAPALLYAILAVIFTARTGSASFDLASTHIADALIVIAVVALLMLIGLIIDRRAFVTSGLVSFGVAIARIFQENGADLGGYEPVILLIVGVVVLVVGVGWAYFRRAVLAALPDTLKSRLPPVR